MRLTSPDVSVAPAAGALPGESRLHHLLIECRTLPEVLEGLADWVAERLADHAVGCGIALERPKHAVVSAASDHATGRLMASWLARGASPLAAALGDSISVIAPEVAGVRRSSSRRSRGNGEPERLVALPIRLEDGACAALVLRGPSIGPHARELLGAVGHCRRDAAWVLRLATRYARQCELAEQRAAAMENRTAIDIAIGVIMGQNRCAPEDAFQILKRASNARNDKLHHVARVVVAGVTAADIHTKFDE